MVVWINSIVNRSNSSCKYNVSDLNRVENNTQFLSDLLAQRGYNNAIVTKVDWADTNVSEFNQSHSSRIVQNIDYLRNIFVSTGIDLPESMDYLTYVDANNIELNLDKVFNMIEAMVYSLNNFNRCGTIYSGGSLII